MEPTLPRLWGQELCWMGSRPLRQELERQYSRFGSFPGLEARKAAFQELWPEAGPKLGAVPNISFQRPPWSLGRSPQPGPLPHHHSLPSLSPVFRTPGGLYCYQWSLEDWGGDEEQLGSFCSLLGGMEVAQMGQDVVGLWAAEASSLMAHGVIKMGEEMALPGGKEHTSRRLGVWPFRKSQNPLMSRNPRPKALGLTVGGLPGPPGYNHVQTKEKGLPVTFLFEIAMPKEKAPGRSLVLLLSPSRTVMNPEFGSKKDRDRIQGNWETGLHF